MSFLLEINILTHTLTLTQFSTKKITFSNEFGEDKGDITLPDE
jgi:hypothetical protein